MQPCCQVGWSDFEAPWNSAECLLSKAYYDAKRRQVHYRGFSFVSQPQVLKHTKVPNVATQKQIRQNNTFKIAQKSTFYDNKYQFCNSLICIGPPTV